MRRPKGRCGIYLLKGWYDILLGQRVHVLCHKSTNTLVWHQSTLVHDYIVGIPIVVFKGKRGHIVLVYLVNVVPWPMNLLVIGTLRVAVHVMDYGQAGHTQKTKPRRSEALLLGV